MWVLTIFITTPRVSSPSGWRPPQSELSLAQILQSTSLLPRLGEGLAPGLLGGGRRIQENPYLYWLRGGDTSVGAEPAGFLVMSPVCALAAGVP